MTRRPIPTAGFILSVEPTNGKTFHHPHNLGTDLAVAKARAAELFIGRNRAEDWTRSVALIDSATGKIVDFFDGEWQSDRVNAMFDEEAGQGAAA